MEEEISPAEEDKLLKEGQDAIKKVEAKEI